jgi:hypothetical protein
LVPAGEQAWGDDVPVARAGKLVAGVAIRDRDTRENWALHVYRPERAAA